MSSESGYDTSVPVKNIWERDIVKNAWNSAPIKNAWDQEENPVAEEEYKDPQLDGQEVKPKKKLIKPKLEKLETTENKPIKNLKKEKAFVYDSSSSINSSVNSSINSSVNKSIYTDILQFSKIGLEKPIKDIISKLLFISKINVGEKLNTKEFFVRDNNIITQRLIRTIKNYIYNDLGEYKQDALKFLENTIKEALEFVYIYYTKQDEFSKNIAFLLLKNIHECKQGIENLSQTYSNDRNFVSDIQSLIQTLNLKLDLYSRKK